MKPGHAMIATYLLLQALGIYGLIVVVESAPSNFLKLYGAHVIEQE